MMHWDEGMYGFNMGHPLGWVMMILFWVFIIMGIIYLVKNLRGPAPPEDDTPLEIVKKRYARGEITREEYQSFKKDLES